MPSALVRALAAPLHELQASVGTGTPDATSALATVRATLDDVALAAGRSWQGTQWVGDAGAAAADFTESTVAALDAMAARASQLGTATTDAGAAVGRARSRLQAIIEEFEARAEALESTIDEPGAAAELDAEARRALDEAEAVIEELRGELQGHQSAVEASAPPGPPPTLPMGALSGLGGALGSVGSAPSSGMGAASSPGAGVVGGGPSHLAASTEARPEGLPSGAQPLADPGTFGAGVSVHLPDGSVATAPNAVAASAVRHALTQLGVPYDWGGTTPGVGLDCSGLTQWAYREAGLELPRLAQEQDVGSAVTQSTVRPGDLAVWDGHVAMIVGNGQMVEAGDPVKLSPIRTTNAGQGFQGFWRPTA